MHCAFLVGGDCDSVCAGKTTIVPEPVMNLITPDVGRRGGVHWPTEVGDIAEAAPQTHPHHHGTRVSHAHPLLAYCGFGTRVHSHVLSCVCRCSQPEAVYHVTIRRLLGPNDDRQKALSTSDDSTRAGVPGIRDPGIKDAHTTCTW